MKSLGLVCTQPPSPHVFLKCVMNWVGACQYMTSALHCSRFMHGRFVCVRGRGAIRYTHTTRVSQA